MKFRRLFFLLFIVFSAGYSFGQFDQNRINAEIEKGMEYFIGDVPGALICVMDATGIIYHKPMGMADLQNKIAVNTEMKFDMVILNEQITTLAILTLVDKGKLDLNKKVSEIIDDFPSYGKDISVMNLLNHTSGLKSFEYGSINSNKELPKYLTDHEISFLPGEKHEYSNSNYVLLTLVVEKVSKKSYDKYLDKKVFKSLGISSGFRNIGSNKAIGHTLENNVHVRVDYSPENRLFGLNGLYMSIDDYAKLNDLLYGQELMSNDVYRKQFAKIKLVSGEELTYALGWNIMKRRGLDYYWNAGKGSGFSSVVLHLPQNKLTVIVLLNRDDLLPLLKVAFNVANLFTAGWIL